MTSKTEKKTTIVLTAVPCFIVFSGDGSKIEYLGESRAKFTYPCGHHEIKNWGKGNVTKRMPPECSRGCGTGTVCTSRSAPSAGKRASA